MEGEENRSPVTGPVEPGSAETGTDREALESMVEDCLRSIGDVLEGRRTSDDLDTLIRDLLVNARAAFANAPLVATEIESLFTIIERTRAEISALSNSSELSAGLSGASDELDAIVSHTEQAANQIMDAADAISQLADEADDAMAEKLTAIATKIFEASTFQDITGQRVRKVISLLQIVEDRLERVRKLIPVTSADTKPTASTSHTADEDEGLLNGPQLAGEGVNQDDVDALFAD